MSRQSGVALSALLIALRLVAARACVRFEALTYTSKAACDAANDRASAAVFWRSWASDDTLRKVLDEFVHVPRYDLQETAAGLWPGDEKAKFTMAFRRCWVENYLHARPEDLSVLRVHGDSMYPVLHDGDNILINHAFTSPQDGIYVIRADGQVLVKQLQRLHGPFLRVISANPDYPPYEVNPWRQMTAN